MCFVPAAFYYPYGPPVIEWIFATLCGFQILSHTFVAAKLRLAKVAGNQTDPISTSKNKLKHEVSIDA
jgi:hypothetical protein